MKIQSGLYKAEEILKSASKRNVAVVPTEVFASMDAAIDITEKTEELCEAFALGQKDLDMCSEDGGVNNSAPPSAPGKEDPLRVGLRALKSEVSYRIDHVVSSCGVSGHLGYVRDRLNMILGQGG